MFDNQAQEEELNEYIELVEQVKEDNEEPNYSFTAMNELIERPVSQPTSKERPTNNKRRTSHKSSSGLSNSKTGESSNGSPFKKIKWGDIKLQSQPQTISINENSQDRFVSFGMEKSPHNLSNSMVLKARKQRRTIRLKNKESDRMLFMEEDHTNEPEQLEQIKQTEQPEQPE